VSRVLEPARGRTKPQYFLSYAVLGSIVPYLSVLLDERGLSKSEIGRVNSAGSLAVTMTPVLITLLADTAIAGRFLMALLFTLAGAAAVAMVPAKGLMPLLLLYAAHCLVRGPIFPLQDGIHFSAQARRIGRGLREVPFHSVRVWGTIGYIAPTIVLYFLLKPGSPVTASLYCCAAFAALGAVYALVGLPHTPAPPRVEAQSRLPTIAAAKTLFGERHVAVFCVSMFLLGVASTAFYMLFPLHLTGRSGIDKRWVGVVQNIGTVCEIAFVYWAGALQRLLGLRRLMYVGAFYVGLRVLVLAVFPQTWVAVAIQVPHGLTVIVYHVIAPAFLNQHAGDRYRNSIQGLYTMSVSGAAQVIGGYASGILAQRSIATAFVASGTLAMVATGLLFFAFHEGSEKREAMSE
jgi:MFS transporter, PPP family, 3-phenylpropionic acid transporter